MRGAVSKHCISISEVSSLFSRGGCGQKFGANQRESQGLRPGLQLALLRRFRETFGLSKSKLSAIPEA
jgi:hypothetical protein